MEISLNYAFYLFISGALITDCNKEILKFCPHDLLIQNAVQSQLTHSHLETSKRVIGKQCRPRSDATKCGV